MIGLVGIIPFPVLYFLSTLLANLNFYVIGYRKSVMLKNLNIAFPELNGKPLKDLCIASYQNLFDITLESIKGFSLSPETITKRYHLENPDVIDQYFHKKSDLVVYASHFGNWEWGTIALPNQLKHHIIGLIKPVKNPFINDYIWSKRSSQDVSLISIYGDKSKMYEESTIPKFVVFIADQNATNMEKAIKVNFFNHETYCLHGAEEYAHKRNVPVIYFSIQRIKRGYYKVVPTLICEKPNGIDKGVLTQIYMSQLEKDIRTRPSDWLWTHKRWKHQIKY